VYFVAIWNLCCSFGIFYGHLVAQVCCAKKILVTLDCHGFCSVKKYEEARP
jgi:hypothetical protein